MTSSSYLITENNRIIPLTDLTQVQQDAWARYMQKRIIESAFSFIEIDEMEAQDIVQAI